MKLFSSVLLLPLLIAGCAEPVTETPYREPLVSPGAQFGGLPPSVQNTIRAQAGGADIYNITKQTAPNGSVVYEIHFENFQRFPPMFVAPDGSVLNPNMTVAVGAAEEPTIGAVSGGAVGGIRAQDLPIEVTNTIRDKAPNAEIAYIHKLALGQDHIAYEVFFKGGHSKMLIAENGRIIE